MICLPAELPSDSDLLILQKKQAATITARTTTTAITDEQPYLRIVFKIVLEMKLAMDSVKRCKKR